MLSYMVMSLATASRALGTLMSVALISWVGVKVSFTRMMLDSVVYT